MNPNDIMALAKKAKTRLHANDNVFDFLDKNDIEVETIQKNVELAVEQLLTSLLIDYKKDHNTKDTPRRVAKMFIHEVFAGRFKSKPKITEFPNVTNADELYVIGPIAVRSYCSHHLIPIEGECYIGVMPSKKVLGLSKFNRLAYWVFSRPQIQEEAINQLADELESLLKPHGVGVVIKARQVSCRSARFGSADYQRSAQIACLIWAV